MTRPPGFPRRGLNALRTPSQPSALTGAPAPVAPWTPDSWRSKPARQQPVYSDPAELEAVTRELSVLPPLVTSFEVERLKALLAEAQEGRRFLLQGGDCAERLDDCRADPIARRLKILLQMSLVLTHGLQKPVVRVGRFAGQYAKPRSRVTETRTVDGVAETLPSYFGDLVNRLEFESAARQPDPQRLKQGFYHAAMTLNFVRALVEGGFTDWQQLERWDLAFFRAAALSSERKSQYERVKSALAEALRRGDGLLQEHSAGADHFYASHEGLHLEYERALTRDVPHRRGYYCLSTHLPWIGDRTRGLDEAHVEFFRGLRNPVGVKLGPSATPEEVRALALTLNPEDEPGRLVLLSRVGADRVEDHLPAWIQAVEDRRVLWVCDPMHGNTTQSPSGFKTRSFDAIVAEFEQTFAVHERMGRTLGGLHCELTADDVTECIGGSEGLEEASLNVRYETACDPRLNYQQSLELAFLLAHHRQSR